jgi:hypothetical protein
MWTRGKFPGNDSESDSSDVLQVSGDYRILSGFGADAEAVVHSGWCHSRRQAESEGVATLATTLVLPRSLRASSSQGAKRIRLKKLVAGCVLACLVVCMARRTPVQGLCGLCTGTLSGSASKLGAGLLLPTVYALVSPGERQGLVNLYLATNGSMWANQAGWSSFANASVDPCTPTSWGGVFCGPGGVNVVYVSITRCKITASGHAAHASFTSHVEPF